MRPHNPQNSLSDRSPLNSGNTGGAITLELPWPPSVNHYWRNVRGAMLISREGRSYRMHVLAAWLQAGRPRVDGRLALTILAHAPDRRRRDLDNLAKAPLDALAHAGVYDDDSQIDHLAITRGPIDPQRPRIVVYVGRRKIGGADGAWREA